MRMPNNFWDPANKALPWKKGRGTTVILSSCHVQLWVMYVQEAFVIIEVYINSNRWNKIISIQADGKLRSFDIPFFSLSVKYFYSFYRSLPPLLNKYFVNCPSMSAYLTSCSSKTLYRPISSPPFCPSLSVYLSIFPSLLDIFINLTYPLWVIDSLRWYVILQAIAWRGLM